MPRAVDGTTQRALDALQARIVADPDIQRILAQNRDQLAATRDKGGSARDYQNRVRDQITAIAKQKGYVPKEGQSFVNPNDGNLEPHGGWAGLSNKTRAAIIAAAGVATWGATGFAGAGALGLGGGGGGGVGAVNAAGVYTTPAYAGAGLPFAPAAATGAGVGAGGTLATSLPGEMTGTIGGPAGAIPGINGATGTAAGGFGWGDLLREGGRGLASIGDSAATNRDAQLYAQLQQGQLANQRAAQETTRDQDYWNQGVEREKEGRESGTDAWRRMLQAQRVLSPGPSPSLSPYSVADRERTETERTGAQAMSDEVMKRLQGGNPLPTPTRRPDLQDTMDMRLARPGGVERATNWLGPILNIGSRFLRR